MDTKKLIEDYLDMKDWKVKENSNMSYSLQGLNQYIHSEIVKDYWLNIVYDQNIKQAHEEGWFHIHDLGSLSVYCVGWDLEDLLKEGFTGVPGKLTSKPAKHFSTVLMQIVNFMYTLQGEAAGAVAFSNFDTFLAPFIRYDNLNFEEVKQKMQEFIFNMNVPTRVGFQTPFSNLTFDLTCPKDFEDKNVIIGGKELPATYKEFDKEMEMLNKAFIEVMMEGDGVGRPFTFPIPTYNITKDTDWDSQIMELIMKLTAKYGTPYFANFVSSNMDPSDVRSMCCRLRLDNKKVRKHIEFFFEEKRQLGKKGGLFSSNPLTGSIGVVTINLPRIGFVSKTKDDLYRNLDEILEIAVRSLEKKREFLEIMTEKGLYPYTKFYLRNVKASTGQYWTNHFSTIGIIGMHEMLLNFLGVGIDDPKGKNPAIEIMDHILEKLDFYTKLTGNLYNLEATPAESASYRLAVIDRKMFPKIITSGTKERPYYTNSTMLPVNYSEDPFEVLEHQTDLQIKYTGGTVLHLYIGEKITDIQALKTFLKTVFENYPIPYITITPTFSICQNHGYIPGEQFKCPYCGRETEVYSRVVGYYRPVQNWNDGKYQEFTERAHYKIFASDHV